MSYFVHTSTVYDLTSKFLLICADEQAWHTHMWENRQLQGRKQCGNHDIIRAKARTVAKAKNNLYPHCENKPYNYPWMDHHLHDYVPSGPHNIPKWGWKRKGGNRLQKVTQ